MHINYSQELLKDQWFISGLVMAVVFASVALLGPFLSPYDPHDMSFSPLSPPSSKHFLGVNDGGMDIFTELLFGLRNTAYFGVLAALSGLFLGVILGVTSAWLGGWIDHALMQLAHVLLAIPSIMVLIIIAALFRPSPIVLALILAAMSWPTTAKACRSQALILKRSLHLQAARQMGAKSFYIISRHLIPELFPLYLIGFTAKARAAIFMEASLAFLGLFDPGRKSLGNMISYALKFYYLDIWWHWLMPPILCLSLLMITVTFIAISLEGIFDPRLREGWQT